MAARAGKTVKTRAQRSSGTPTRPSRRRITSRVDLTAKIPDKPKTRRRKGESDSDDEQLSLDDIVIDTKNLDPIMDTPVYFMSKVGIEQGRAGAQLAAEIRKGCRQKPRPTLPSRPLDYYINNFDLTREEFDEALKCYENNQTCMAYNKDYSHAHGLEAWFIQVVESPPRYDPSIHKSSKAMKQLEQNIDAWRQLELKKQKGYSPYCDPDIRHRIHLNPEVRRRVMDNISRIERDFSRGIHTPTLHNVH